MIGKMSPVKVPPSVDLDRILGVIIPSVTGILFLILFIVGSGEGETVTVDAYGAGDYTTIQSAIDSASAGAMIRVWDGTYFESISVNKPISLIGNGSDSTIIIGDNSTDVINITANSVTVSGFSITNGMWGISVFSNNNSFSNNEITNNSHGIRLKYCENNTIKDNLISANYSGISGWFAHQNRIINNTIFGNNHYGIDFQISDNNSIIDNNFSNNRQGVFSSNGGNYTIVNNLIFLHKTQILSNFIDD